MNITTNYQLRTFNYNMTGNNKSLKTNPTFNTKNKMPITYHNIGFKAGDIPIRTIKTESNVLTDAVRNRIRRHLQESYRYTDKQIELILRYLKLEYADAVDIVLNAQNTDKTYRFDNNSNKLVPDTELSSIMHGFYKSEIKNPMDYFKTLLDATNKEGAFRFDSNDIGRIIINLTEDNVELFNDLITMENSDGTFRFDNVANRGTTTNIGEALSAATRCGKDVVKTMMYAKNGENYQFNPWDVSFIPETYKGRIDTLQQILSHEDLELSARDVNNIMSISCTPENIEKFNKLYAIYRAGKPIGFFNKKLSLIDICMEFDPRYDHRDKLSDKEINTVYDTISEPELFFKQ